MSRAARLQRARSARGGRAREAGRTAEVLAAIWLMLHGWRILGFRLKTPEGEIDLLARRGGVLAVVEVKARPTLAQAMDAVRPVQRERLARAGAAVAARRASLRGLGVRLDLIAMVPGRLPLHRADAWRVAERGGS